MTGPPRRYHVRAQGQELGIKRWPCRLDRHDRARAGAHGPGPIEASKQPQRAKMTIDDIDIVEINEGLRRQ